MKSIDFCIFSHKNSGRWKILHKFRKKRVVLIVTSAALIGALSFSTLLSDFALGDDTQKINDLTKQQQNLQNQIKDTKNDLKNTTI